MSLPMMISMLVQALYNIIDSIFVAQISEAALTAVSLAFPIQNLMIAVSAGTCVGVNALLSRSLGEGRRDLANLAAVNGVFLAFVSYAVFAIMGLTLSRFYFSSQTSNPEIIELGVQYMIICTVLGFGIFGEMMFERIIQAIDQLPERERMVILLRFYKNLTQDRVSKVLGVSQVQVSRIERRAVAKLREALME